MSHIKPKNSLPCAIVLVTGFICFLLLALGPVGGLICLVLARRHLEA